MFIRSALGDPVPRAVRALVATRNPDGGIPAIKSKDPSGCWTTASTLEAVLLSGQVEAAGMKAVLGMVSFLLGSQLDRNTDGGAGWPLIAGGRASTMATGDAVAALAAVRPILDHDAALQKRIHEAVATGMSWLSDTQQPDGGWGTEPESGHDGAASRMISTFMAIHGYAALGERHATSSVVRRASAWIENGYVEGVGWPPIPGANCDPASSARAISALSRANDPWLNAKRADVLVEHLLAWRLEESLWSIAVENVLHGDASGAIVFNQNTNVDVLLALLDTPEPERYVVVVAELVNWLRSTQDTSTGLWRLQSPLRVDAAVTTWSTAEWVIGVASGRALLASQYAAAAASSRHIDVGHIVLALCAVILLVLYVEAPAWLGDRWSDLSNGQRGAVLTVAGGVVIAVLAEMILSPVRALLRRARENRVMGRPKKNRAPAMKGKQNG